MEVVAGADKFEVVDTMERQSMITYFDTVVWHKYAVQLLSARFVRFTLCVVNVAFPCFAP